MREGGALPRPQKNKGAMVGAVCKPPHRYIPSVVMLSAAKLAPNQTFAASPKPPLRHHPVKLSVRESYW
jgi:hypothetical protein